MSRPWAMNSRNISSVYFESILSSSGPRIASRGESSALSAGLFTQRNFIIDFTRNRLLVKAAMDEFSPGE